MTNQELVSVVVPEESNLAQGAALDSAVSESVFRGEDGVGSRRTLLLLSIACAVAVANVYYCQPLLLQMASSLRLPATAAGFVVVAIQVGYALGILGFAPMGDSFERKRLMVLLFLAASAAALFISFAHSVYALLAGAFVLGAAAAVTHVAVPVAPEIAGVNRGGRAVGTVMTGILTGILLARTVSGLLSKFVGWRGVYLGAFLVDLLCALLLLRILPTLRPERPVKYPVALRSLWQLLRQSPLLQESMLVGGASMAAFSALWTTLTFLLESPHYGYGPALVGAFGLLGIAGVVVAPIVGRAIDRYGASPVLRVALLTQVVGFVLLWTFGYKLPGLIAGILCFDGGMQATQISNQARIFGINPHARARLNTIYMTAYFGFAAVGSALGSAAWSHANWHGVTGLGLGFIAIAAVSHFLFIGLLRPAGLLKQTT